MVQCGADKEGYRALAACALDRVEKTEPTLQVLVVSPFRDDVVKVGAYARHHSLSAPNGPITSLPIFSDLQCAGQAE